VVDRVVEARAHAEGTGRPDFSQELSIWEILGGCFVLGISVFVLGRTLGVLHSNPPVVELKAVLSVTGRDRNPYSQVF